MTGTSPAIGQISLNPEDKRFPDDLWALSLQTCFSGLGKPFLFDLSCHVKVVT